MKKMTIAALVSAQLLAAAQPLSAAPLDDGRFASGEQQRGAFIGARFRIPFGGENSGRPRAALSLTSVEHGFSADGARGRGSRKGSSSACRRTGR